MFLVFNPFLFCGAGWFGRFACFLRGNHTFDQLLQATQRLRAILILAAVLLRLDHNHAIFGNAMVTQRQQPFFVELWQL